MNLTEVEAIVREEWQLLKLLGYNACLSLTTGISQESAVSVWHSRHINLLGTAIQTIALMLENGLEQSSFIVTLATTHVKQISKCQISMDQ